MYLYYQAQLALGSLSSSEQQQNILRVSNLTLDTDHMDVTSIQSSLFRLLFPVNLYIILLIASEAK